MNIIEENVAYRRKLRGMKKHCPRAYKDLMYKIHTDNLDKTEDGVHKVELLSDRIFKFVYGPILFMYTVKNGVITSVDLEPSSFLEQAYIRELGVYKSCYYVNDLDKFKIDIALKIEERKM